MRLADMGMHKIIEEDYTLQSDREEQMDKKMKRWVVLGGFFFLLNLCLIIIICLNHTVSKRSEAVAAFVGTEVESAGKEEADNFKMSDLSEEVSDKEELIKEEDTEPAGKKDNVEKRVYLTFDDGPSKNTEKILDVLKEYDIQATFFVIGREDDFSKKMYQRIVSEGHTLGMHSYSHEYSKIYQSKKSFFRDLRKINDLLYEATGEEPIYYRFPGGTSNQVSKVPMKTLIKGLTEQGKVYFDWNAMSGDASGKNLTKRQMINNVLEDVKIHNTSIVLMHDNADKTNTVKILPELLDELLGMEVQILPIDKDTPLVQHVTAE